MRVWVRGLRSGQMVYGTRRWDGTDKVLRIGVGSLGPGGAKVQGLKPKGEGSGFRVQGSGFRVQGSGLPKGRSEECRLALCPWRPAVALKVQGSGFKVSGSLSLCVWFGV